MKQVLCLGTWRKQELDEDCLSLAVDGDVEMQVDEDGNNAVDGIAASGAAAIDLAPLPRPVPPTSSPGTADVNPNQLISRTQVTSTIETRVAKNLRASPLVLARD